MMQDDDDRCVLPGSTEGKDKSFAGGYKRQVLDGAGHFPTREAPDAVAQLIAGFLGRT